MMRSCSMRQSVTKAESQSTVAHSRIASRTRQPPSHPALTPAFQDARVSSPEESIERSAEAMAQRALRSAPSRSSGPRTPGARSAGLSLPAAVRSELEPRFGWDFSRVRVHVDDEAARAANAVQARAYTVGRDIVFGAGEYAPATTGGRQLLAHELAHVVQHEAALPGLAGGGVLLRQPKDKPARPNEPVRQSTEEVEDIRGQKAPTHRLALKKLRLLVVLWDPGRKDQGPRPTAQEIDESLFGSQASSLREFYLNQSGGTAVIEKVAVLDWVKAEKPADHYWHHPENAKDGFKDGHIEKWAEALGKADKRVDFASFDENGDLKLTAEELGILIVIPQKSPFGTNRPTEGPNQKPLVLDGVEIGWIAEVYMPSPMNLGVTRHELGHLFFGFPDVYANQKYPGHGADDYSLMAVTYTDAQIDAPLRFKKGWITGSPIRGSGSYKIASIEDSREALVYERAGSKPPEYFLIELRLAGKYDRDLPAHGLVIWRFVDDGNPESIYRFTPHGKGAWPMDQRLDAFPLDWSDGKSSGVTVSVDPNLKGTVQIDVSASAASKKP